MAASMKTNLVKVSGGYLANEVAENWRIGLRNWLAGSIPC